MVKRRALNEMYRIGSSLRDPDTAARAPAEIGEVKDVMLARVAAIAL